MFGGEAGTSSVAVVQQAHIRTIAYLQQSGLKYVIVREGIYAESWWLYAGFQPREGYPAPRSGSNGVALDGHDEGLKEQGDKGVIEWVIPADGPVAWVSWTELAEATALILAEYEKYIGQTLNLTGCETKTITQLAELVERETGRKVDIRILGMEEAVRYQKERRAVPEENSWIVDAWGTFHGALERGETGVVDGLLERLIGRRPRTMGEMAGTLFVEQ